MDLATALRELWSLKIWVVGIAALALLVSVSTAYRVHFLPPSLEKKSLEYGAAQTQILIDSPSSTLADLGRDFAPLAERAQVFSQFMASPPVKDEIAEAVGLPAGAVTAQASVATQNLPRSATEPGQGERANELLAEGVGYKLSFEAQESLPIVTVYAQAPEAEQAIKLADGAAVGLRSYLAKVEARQRVPELRQVRIVALGAAKGGVVNSGANRMVAMVAFLGVLAFGCVALLVVSSAASGMRGRASGAPGVDLEAMGDLGVAPLRPYGQTIGNGNGNGSPQRARAGGTRSARSANGRSGTRKAAARSADAE